MGQRRRWRRRSRTAHLIKENDTQDTYKNEGDMRKNRLFTTICLMAVALLAACTQDELAEQGNTLPDGEYPLQIGSVSITAEASEEPWTRIAENETDGMGSHWTGDDEFYVKFEGSDEVGIYKITDAATGAVKPVKSIYWKSTQPANIIAWYPLNEELDFTHQNQGLTYLLKATGNGDYQSTPINLNFIHQLAKVRVKLEGTKADEVTAVTVCSYPTSTHSHGTLDSQDRSLTPQYVSMREATYDGVKYWEANLRPGTLQANNSFEVAKAEGAPVRVTLDADVPITAGQVHTITIGVEQAPTEIDLSTYEDPTLAVSGKTILKGDGQQKNLQITVEAAAEITLENVVLSPSATGNAITCNGDATITLVGNNKLTAKSDASPSKATYGSGIYVESGTLIINGDGNLNISREYVGSYGNVGAGIGAGSGANILIESGNIQIGDVPSEGVESGAGIGSLPKESCGDITINGGTISIGKTSWWSACIGSAQPGSCGNITISGESTVITYTQGIHAPCGIGNGERGTCGTVTITGGATVNGTRYYDHTGTL